MELVLDKKLKRPATHAIVIGVGYYKYLPGGEKEKEELENHRLGQLTSPPYSAREFTKWLLSKFRNLKNPLSSVELLLSEKDDSYYEVSPGNRKKVNRATTMTTVKAINQWKDRGDMNEDNLMIFYFCGHGVACGPIATILMEDFGELGVNNPFFNSIDFTHLETAMNTCNAKKQLFFIDACRVGSQTLMRSFRGPYGQKALRADSWPITRKVSAFYSTGEGQKAYSKKNSPSFFTQALLRCLNGAGSQISDNGAWEVVTDWLRVYLGDLMPKLYQGYDQDCTVDKNDRFLIHQIDGDPIIPVVVTCNPEDANKYAQLSYIEVNGTRKGHRKEPEKSDWNTDIEAGRYLFNAHFPGGEYGPGSKEQQVQPAIVRVPIMVT